MLRAKPCVFQTQETYDSFTQSRPISQDITSSFLALEYAAKSHLYIKVIMGKVYGGPVPFQRTSKRRLSLQPE